MSRDFNRLAGAARRLGGFGVEAAPFSKRKLKAVTAVSIASVASGDTEGAIIGMQIRNSMTVQKDMKAEVRSMLVEILGEEAEKEKEPD